MLNTQAFHAMFHGPLPGAAAHSSMQPQPPVSTLPGAYREAAVLVLLSPLGLSFPDRVEDLVVTLIRRARSTHHSRELAFPGGIRENDEPLRSTALREAEEEVGVNARSVKVLGTLSTVTTATSRALILPVVAVANRYLELRANPEVAALIQVPLGSLLRPGVRHIETAEHPELGTRRIPYFAIGNARLWGASAKIMAELLAVMDGNEYLAHAGPART